VSRWEREGEKEDGPAAVRWAGRRWAGRGVGSPGTKKRKKRKRPAGKNEEKLGRAENGERMEGKVEGFFKKLFFKTFSNFKTFQTLFFQVFKLF
jgi:IS5 family transposase